MHTIILLMSLASSSGVTGADIAKRVQPDLDTFIFCVLDQSVAALPSQEATEAIASSAADSCLKELESLERAVAEQYRNVNKDVWPAGLAEQVARENRDEYYRLAIQAAIKGINERRASP